MVVVLCVPLRFVILVLAVLLAPPTALHAQPAPGGAPPTLPQAEWRISLDARCTQSAGGSPACRTLLGSGGRLRGHISIRPNADASALIFTAMYTRTRPALPPGAGKAANTAVCAFGLGADRQRVFLGSPPGHQQVCTTTIRGHMLLRPGAVAHFGQRFHFPQFRRLRDFWITDETATLSSAAPGRLVDPLGRGHYPIDTRLPAAGDGVHTYDANIYLGILGVPGYPTQVVTRLDGISLTVTVTQEPLAGGRSPKTATPWVVRRTLDVRRVRGLCSTHPSAHFIASVRGYLATAALQRLGGGWVGRLFVKPNPHAFFGDDTQPFVQVWGTGRWTVRDNHLATAHGNLTCDAAAERADLPGWQASIRPDGVTASPAATAT